MIKIGKISIISRDHKYKRVVRKRHDCRAGGEHDTMKSPQIFKIM